MTHQFQHPTPTQHQDSSEWTSIRVHRDTLAKLNRLGKFRETYAELLDRLASQALGLSVSPEESSF